MTPRRWHAKCWHSAALACLVLASCTSGSVVVSPESLRGEHVHTTVMGFSRDLNVTRPGLPVALFDESWCSQGCAVPADIKLAILQSNASRSGARNNEVSERFAGKALLHREVSEVCYLCGIEQLAVMSREAGATAMLWPSRETIGYNVFVFRTRAIWDSARGFPAFEMRLEQARAFARLLDDGVNLTLDISEDRNAWARVFSGPWIGVQVINSVLAMAMLVYAGYGLAFVLRFRRGHRSFRIAVAVLSIEIAGNMLRLLFAAVDPGYSREVFSYAVGRFLVTVSIPFGLMSAVLLFLMWNDLLHATYNLQASVVRTRMRWGAALTIGVVLVGIDLGSSFVSVAVGVENITFIVVNILSACTLLLAMGIFWVGTRLLQVLDRYWERSFEDLPRGTLHGKRPVLDSEKSFGQQQLSVIALPAETMNTTQASSGFATINTTSTMSRARKLGHVLVRKLACWRVPTGHFMEFRGSRAAQEYRVRKLTRKIRWMAVFMALGSLSLVVGAQEAILFNPIPRAVSFVVFGATQALRSYFTISFFKPARV